jgi:hypothetical protein
MPPRSEQLREEQHSPGGIRTREKASARKAGHRVGGRNGPRPRTASSDLDTSLQLAAQEDHEIRAVAGFRAQCLVRDDERRSRRRYLGATIPCVLRNDNPVEHRPRGDDRPAFGCGAVIERCWFGSPDCGRACSVWPGSCGRPLLRWHRAGFRSYWRWKSRIGAGRPRIERELRDLIRRMNREKPLWGGGVAGAADRGGISVEHGTCPSQKSYPRVLLPRPLRRRMPVTANHSSCRRP